MTKPPTGVLLVNLGTPASPAVGDVRRYLREFLSDPRVIDIPAPLRWLLLELIILPTRPRASAAAYRKVWTDSGSPLLTHSTALAEGVARALGDAFRVELGMRYGAPSIPDALARLEEAGASALVIAPLFPQYASASTGSAVERTFAVLGGRAVVPPVAVLPPFYDEPSFIESVAELAEPALARFGADFVLLSYHGLPERQVRATDATGKHCLSRDDCCAAIGTANANCYRAQCYSTTRALAERLGLAPDAHSTAFQSRLGRTPWIKPYTDEVLPELAASGVKRLAVLSPSFVADCLETIEEIGIRARDQWRALGGDDLLLVPAPNGSKRLAQGIAESVRAVGIRGGR